MNRAETLVRNEAIFKSGEWKRIQNDYPQQQYVDGIKFVMAQTGLPLDQAYSAIREDLLINGAYEHLRGVAVAGGFLKGEFAAFTQPAQPKNPVVEDLQEKINRMQREKGINKERQERDLFVEAIEQTLKARPKIGLEQAYWQNRIAIADDPRRNEASRLDQAYAAMRGPRTIEQELDISDGDFPDESSQLTPAEEV